MAKSKKIEKETRQLIESISEVIKKKGDRYKFKGNKKKFKKMKKSCVHWIIRKGKAHPLTTSSNEFPGKWQCRLCGHRFPIAPLSKEEYDNRIDQFMEIVDQIQFWSVRLGGDSDDTKLLIRLKRDIPDFRTIEKEIIKQMNKREQWEKNRSKSDIMAQFDAYSGFSYKA